jgi:hypothetical protein
MGNDGFVFVSSYRETTVIAKSFGPMSGHLRLAFAERVLNLQTTNFNYQSTPMNRSKFLFFAACLVIGCQAKSADKLARFQRRPFNLTPVKAPVGGVRRAASGFGGVAGWPNRLCER